jgi:hypothetical protein
MVAGLLVASAGADMDFIDIGEAGNAADVVHAGEPNGYGAVGYDYRIGTFEVTIEQFNEGVGVGTASGAAGTPAVEVDFSEAARFANWLTSGDANIGAYTISGGLVTATMSRTDILADGGLFYVLPTVDEWYKAAFFKDSTYSFYANGMGSAPSPGLGGANYANAIGAPWVVGSGTLFEQNGTKDMAGNVWEWTETEQSSATRVIYGGAFNESVTAIGSSSSPNLGVTSSGDALGFRVVAIPEPGTISLMSLSTISLFFTRTVRRRKLAGRSLLPVRHEHFCDAYLSVDEWEASLVDETEVAGYLDPVKEVVLPPLQLAWSKVCGNYKELDQIFWNHMVAVHESRTMARKAFRIAFKQKTLACLDGFLSLFMK